MMQLKIIFYDCLHYPLLFGIGGAVNIVEEEEDSMTYQFNYTGFLQFIIVQRGPKKLG